MAAAAHDLTLPLLREDLQLLEGPSDLDGSPTWTIFDPVRNRFFRIGWTAFQLLSRWSLGRVDRLVQAVCDTTTCQVTPWDVAALIKFLYANSLTKASATGKFDAYLQQYQASRPHWAKWLVHNYLFVRIPILRPHRFLRASLPLVKPLFSRSAGLIVLALGGIGLYLVSRQWEAFLATFLHFFTLEGAALYGVALAAIKILHELGHAYTATRFGCRVATMGIALLVLFPVLYTDTTDAWRLRSRRKRMLIGAAGIITELAIAAIRTFLWSFLPEGSLRSAVFIIATTSWLMPLAVNLNPLMRFDGYYILSDLLGVHNLQERSFALAKWTLRRQLFAIQAPPPEHTLVSLQTKLIVYAWATWIYRFFLFIGIALLVYHFFFKALGLVLFAVEIMWFIVLPIMRELIVWWSMRSTAIKTRRFVVIATLVCALLALAFIPWSGRVSFPAILQSAQYATVYAPEPGRIIDVIAKRNQEVKAGDTLLILDSPQLEQEFVLTAKKVEVHRLRFHRFASNPEDLANMHVALRQWTAESSRLAGLEKKRRKLTIRAPISGVITDVADALHRGRWINQKLALAFVVEPTSAELSGLVSETDLTRLKVNQPARFLPDDPKQRPLNARLVEIGEAGINRFELPYLASVYGGKIAVRRDAKDELVPESSVYHIRLAVLNAIPPDRVVRGVVNVAGKPRSFAKRMYDVIASVLIRESGF
ncbi:MAG: HlyD family efflux transporter periplasmic adaptor subunit [Gammaproteobacteria bacterium]